MSPSVSLPLPPLPLSRAPFSLLYLPSALNAAAPLPFAPACPFPSALAVDSALAAPLPWPPLTAPPPVLSLSCASFGRAGLFQAYEATDSSSLDGHRRRRAHEVDRRALGLAQRQAFVVRVFRVANDDSDGFLRRLRVRIDRAGIQIPTAEVRFRGLSVEARNRPPPSPPVLASSLRAAVAVLRRHDQSLASRPRSIFGDVLGYGPSDVGFMPYGNGWWQNKKLVTTHLLNAKKVQSYREVLYVSMAVLGGFSLENFYPGLDKVAGGVLVRPARRRAEKLRDRWDEVPSVEAEYHVEARVLATLANAVDGLLGRAGLDLTSPAS